MKRIILVALVVGSALSWSKNILASSDLDLSIKTSFEAGQPIMPSEQIEVWLSRPLRESESRVAILIGTTDVSALFALDKLRLRYNSKIWPLPLGQSELTAYLVSSNDEWKEVARFTLLVNKETRPFGSAVSSVLPPVDPVTIIAAVALAAAVIVAGVFAVTAIINLYKNTFKEEGRDKVAECQKDADDRLDACVSAANKQLFPFNVPLLAACSAQWLASQAKCLVTS